MHTEDEGRDPAPDFRLYRDNLQRGREEHPQMIGGKGGVAHQNDAVTGNYRFAVAC